MFTVQSHNHIFTSSRCCEQMNILMNNHVSYFKMYFVSFLVKRCERILSPKQRSKLNAKTSSSHLGLFWRCLSSIEVKCRDLFQISDCTLKESNTFLPWDDFVMNFLRLKKNCVTGWIRYIWRIQ